MALSILFLDDSVQREMSRFAPTICRGGRLSEADQIQAQPYVRIVEQCSRHDVLGVVAPAQIGERDLFI